MQKKKMGLFNFIGQIVIMIVVGVVQIHARVDKPPKIVGLMAVRNESAIIVPCLRAMAEYTDAIIVFDDASQDNTVQIVQSVAKECRVAQIICKPKDMWVRDERADKSSLLYAGRAIGGTHFVLLDADEMFTANCAKNNWLRNQILQLKPGQIIKFPMMNLWDGVEQYRDDELCNPYSWKWRAITGVLCDDGVCNYDDNPAWGPSGSMHISREPANRMKGDYPPIINTGNVNYGLIHFKSVSLQDLREKKVWYMCLEFLRANQEKGIAADHNVHAEKINKFYQNEFASMECDEALIRTTPVPVAWVDYSWFDAQEFKSSSIYRKNDILGWIETYGAQYFDSLSIWHIDWVGALRASRS